MSDVIISAEKSDESYRATSALGLAAPRWRWVASWAGRVAEFAFVQSWVQLFTAIAGLIIVRTLSKEEYALFAIANMIQSSADTLAELGIGIGVQSIGGRVWHDRARLGQLLNTALKLRHSFATVSLGVCLPLSIWMLRKNGADWTKTLLLCLIVAAGAIPQLSSSALLIVLGLHGEYRKIQKLNLGNALMRLAAVGLLAFSYMNALLTASIAVVVNWRSFLHLRRWSAVHADPAEPANHDDRCELTRLSALMLPNTVFFCFQGQVTLLILTWFGNAAGIADVTALSRLSVFLTVFAVAFSNVLVPRFARCQDRNRLPRLYLGLVGACAVIMVPVVFAGWLLPDPLLWLLGAKYSGLENECGWVVSTACVSQLSLVMNQLNRARAWVYLGPFAYLPITVSTQMVALMLLDVSHIHGVVVFGFVTSLTPIPTLLVDVMRGLRR